MLVLLANMCILLLFCFHFCSLFYVETADRPGLLVDLVKSVTDIDIAVESGEFDTEVCTYHYTTYAQTKQINLLSSDVAITQNECINVEYGS